MRGWALATSGYKGPASPCEGAASVCVALASGRGGAAGARQSESQRQGVGRPPIDGNYLTETQTLADAFQTGLPDTQSLLDARKNANATYEEVHEAEMAQIYELDKAMSVFEAMNPELYKGYKAARALLDSGGGKAKKKGQLP